MARKSYKSIVCHLQNMIFDLFVSNCALDGVEKQSSYITIIIPRYARSRVLRRRCELAQSRERARRSRSRSWLLLNQFARPRSRSLQTRSRLLTLRARKRATRPRGTRAAPTRDSGISIFRPTETIFYLDFFIKKEKKKWACDEKPHMMQKIFMQILNLVT